MKTEEISNIKSLLNQPKKIVIVPHKNPDGDAIGSSLGLYIYLSLYKHKVSIIAPNDYPDFLKWLPQEHIILKYESNRDSSKTLIEKAEIIFTLDFNALHRTGEMEQPLQDSKAIKIMIDHHQQPDAYAKYMYSDITMSSTCEMIYNFIEMLGDSDLITKDIATSLYAGIMTDTGSFRYPSTTSKTHNVISDLMNKGADNAFIHNAIYDTNSPERLLLLGCALRNLKVLPQYKTAFITISQEELNTFDFKKGDTEGFVNYGLSVENVIFAAIFIEHKQEGIIKISFRSKGDFSVNEFSRTHFDGGGHTNAAGGKSDLNLKDTVEKFITILASYKQALNL